MMGGYPPNGSLSRLGRSRRRIDRRAGAFFQSVDGVDSQILKAADQTAGPADMDRINLGSSAEAKVISHVSIGIVARAAAHFVDEGARAGFHRDLRADAIAIRFRAARSRRKRCSDRAKCNPMIAVAD